MIDFNDRFVGLVTGLLMILAFLGYFVVFGKSEKASKVDKP